MMRVDQGFEEFPAQVGQTPKRAGLVSAHEGRVAGHVRGQNGGKPAFQALCHVSAPALLSPSTSRALWTGSL
jgi:hypothetical protein